VEYFDSCDCSIYQIIGGRNYLRGTDEVSIYYGNTDRSLVVTSYMFYGDQSVNEYLCKREREDTRLEIIAAHLWGNFSAH